MVKRIYLIFIFLLVITNGVSFFLAKSVFRIIDRNVIVLDETDITGRFDISRFSGPEDAAITIIDFSNFSCPYSRKTQIVLNELEKDFPGQIRRLFITYDFKPDKETESLAKAVVAAGNQGRSIEMKDMIFNTVDKIYQESTTDGFNEHILSFADKMSMDMDTFKNDFFSDEIENKVSEDLAIGMDLMIRSTPTIFINGYKIKGAKDKDIYNKILKRILTRN
jgi:protein-disulfide isomerase